MMKRGYENFRFKGIANCDCVCGLKILKLDKGAIVWLTELPENKGTSVTNWYENLANQVHKEFLSGMKPETIEWYEEYIKGGPSGNENTLDRVSLEFDGLNFYSPKWDRSNWFTVRDDSITHHVCGLTSYHPKDLEHKFCGHCYVFLDERSSANRRHL